MTDDMHELPVAGVHGGVEIYGLQSPERIAGMFGARSMSFTIQGTNLGLRTNYRGKDPAVNAYHKPRNS